MSARSELLRQRFNDEEWRNTMSTQISCNGVVVTLSDELGPFDSSLTCDKGEADGIYYVKLKLVSAEAALLPSFKLSWELPSVDFHHKWNPRCGQNRALDVGLGSFNRIESCANSGAPVFSLYSLNG